MPYDRSPRTLGQHLRKRRLQLGLLQKEVANDLRIGLWTYITWETDKANPVISQWPGIIAFLGYDPHSKPNSLPEMLFCARRQRGLTLRQMAARLNVNLSTYERWEQGKGRPTAERLDRVIDLIRGNQKAAQSCAAGFDSGRQMP